MCSGDSSPINFPPALLWLACHFSLADRIVKVLSYKRCYAWGQGEIGVRKAEIGEDSGAGDTLAGRMSAATKKGSIINGTKRDHLID